MKRSPSLFILIFSLLTFMVGWRTPVAAAEDLQVRLLTDKPIYRESENIRLFVHIKNTGDQTQVFDVAMSSFFLMYSARVAEEVTLFPQDEVQFDVSFNELIWHCQNVALPGCDERPALELGINSFDVWIKSAEGSARLMADASVKIRPDVIETLEGWGQVNHVPFGLERLTLEDRQALEELFLTAAAPEQAWRDESVTRFQEIIGRLELDSETKARLKEAMAAVTYKYQSYFYHLLVFAQQTMKDRRLLILDKTEEDFVDAVLSRQDTSWPRRLPAKIQRLMASL